MTSLAPLPELRVVRTAESMGELSPEAQDGRFEGKTNQRTNGASTSAACPVYEQAWHQLAVKCLALRMTYEDTASFCGVGKEAVKHALRAPFFQARLREELSLTSTPLEELFRGAGVRAFNKIIAIMEDDKTPKATQFACAKEVVERNLGKAPQTIKHEDTEAISDPVALVEQLRQQNLALRTQLPN